MNFIQPLISVIITVLNGETTIGSCLESIQKQVFTNYEVVLVDGGSTDNTLHAIERFTGVNKTVKIVPGCSIYEGLNEGVQISRGKWLYFMGSDDKLHNSNTLQTISKAIGINSIYGYKMILGNVHCVAQSEVLRPKTGSPLLMRYHVHHQGIFYRRELFFDIKYNESRKIASDYELNIILRLKKTPFIIIDEIFCSFGGSGTSEKQLVLRNKEIKDVHRSVYNNISSSFVNGQFTIRTLVGSVLRKHHLSSLRRLLKNLFT